MALKYSDTYLSTSIADSFLSVSFLIREDENCSWGPLICCYKTGLSGDANGDLNNAYNGGGVWGDGDEVDRLISSHISEFSTILSVALYCGISGRFPVEGGSNVLINRIENYMAFDK